MAHDVPGVVGVRSAQRLHPDRVAALDHADGLVESRGGVRRPLSSAGVVLQYLIELGIAHGVHAVGDDVLDLVGFAHLIGREACSDHRIFYEDLYNAVLADIQYHARLAYEDRDKAVALAVKMNTKADGSRGKSNESRLKQAKKRYDEVTRLFDRLYEDSLSGRISNDNFARLIDKYQTEQEQLLGQIQSLENALQEVKDSQTNAVQWAALMAEYVGIQELTAENLNLLVERIEVFDRTQTEAGTEQASISFLTLAIVPSRSWALPSKAAMALMFPLIAFWKAGPSFPAWAEKDFTARWSSALPARNPSASKSTSIIILPSALSANFSPPLRYPKSALSLSRSSCSSRDIFFFSTQISLFASQNSRSHFSSFFPLARFCRRLRMVENTPSDISM